MIRLAVLAVLTFAAWIVYNAEVGWHLRGQPRTPVAKKTAARRRPTSKS
jgi:hypothetical protein